MPGRWGAATRNPRSIACSSAGGATACPPTPVRHDTVFQGAHQFPDAIGRVSRLCLALCVIPVFAQPREPGFQNAIEGFNGLWQSKLWQRVHCRSQRDLQQHSDRYVAAHRARNARRREQAPLARDFTFNTNAPLAGTLIFLRRTDAAGRAQLPRPDIRGLDSMAASLGSLRGRPHSPAHPILCPASPRTGRATPAHQPALSPHTTTFPQRLMSDRQLLNICDINVKKVIDSC
ncbi:MAG: hypothetical protein USCGTAYLOR_02774 [Chromatiales bacterium USCg_Taylor]|nr:MAG: hypothetical protein USCGTAYLOR_02774 [Chromatiales bacterium USCg_Taylor]